MNAHALFAIAYLLSPQLAQAQDSVPTDTARALGPRTVITQLLLRSLPIDDPREALTLVPGTVRRGTALGIGAGSGLAFRDGAPGRMSAYIDGAPAQLWDTDSPGLTLSTDAIDRIAITTGIAPADIADAQGGTVIAYTTQSGTPRLAGHVLAHSDEPFGSGSTVGYNRFAASAGGPLGRLVTWLVGGEVIGQSSAYRGLGAGSEPSYALAQTDTVAYGVAIPAFAQTTGLQRPLDWLTQRRAHGKLALHYGAASSLSLTGLISDNQQRFNPEMDLADSALYAGARTASRLGVLNWVQSLGGATGEPSLHAVVSLAHDEAASGPLQATAEQATRDPGLGIAWTKLTFTGADSIPFPLTDRFVRNIRTNTGKTIPFPNRPDLRPVQPYRLNPYGLSMGWPTQGIDGILSLASDARAAARLWLDWRPSPTQTPEVGIDWERGTQTFYQADLLSSLDLDAWRIHARRIGAFAEDRIGLHRLALDVGIRFDHYTTDEVLPYTPGRVFSNPAWSPSAGVDDTAYAASLKRVMMPMRSPSAASPRLGAVYTVSHSVAVRVRYGQMIEAPTATQIFEGSNSDLLFTDLQRVAFGRDVPFLKSTQVDLGILARVADGLDFEITIFHQNEAYYTHLFRSFDDPANPGATLLVNVLTPVDSVHANGFDVGAHLQTEHGLTGWFAYSFTHAAGLTTQSLAAVATYSSPPGWGAALRGVSVTALAHAESGLPYFPLVNSGSGTLALGESGLFGGAISGPLTRLPWTKTLDLRVGKSVQAVGIKGSLYLDLRNLLDLHSLLNAFAETGSPTNSLYEDNVLSPEYANLRIEAAANGVLLSGNAVDLRPDCATWTATTAGPVNCIALRRVERRFGNGDGVYDQSEQTAALTAYYSAVNGAWRFYAPGRTAQIGLELTF